MLETPARPQLIPRDYYQVLGVPRDATPDQIKRAYKQLVHQWHPDRHLTNKEEKARRFMEAHEAYTVLTNPDSRDLYDQIHDSPPSPKASPPKDLHPSPNTPTLGPTPSDGRLPTSPGSAHPQIPPAPGLPSTHQSLDTNLAGASDLDQTVLGNPGGDTAATTPRVLNNEVPGDSVPPTPISTPGINDTPGVTTPVVDPSTPDNVKSPTGNLTITPDDLNTPTDLTNLADNLKSPTDGLKSPADGLKTPSDGLKTPSDGEKTPNIKTPSDIPSTPTNPAADPDNIVKGHSGGTPLNAASPTDESPEDSPTPIVDAENGTQDDKAHAPTPPHDAVVTKDAEAKKPDEEEAAAQHSGPSPVVSNPGPGTQDPHTAPLTPVDPTKVDETPAPRSDAQQAPEPPAGKQHDASDLDVTLEASPPPVKKREVSRGRSPAPKDLGTVFDTIGDLIDSTATRPQSVAKKSAPELDDEKDTNDDDDFDVDDADLAFETKSRTGPITPANPVGELKTADKPIGDFPTDSIPPGDSPIGDAHDPPSDGIPGGIPSDKAPPGHGASGQPHGNALSAADVGSSVAPPDKPADSPIDPPPTTPSDPAPTTPSSTLPVDSNTTTPADPGPATPAHSGTATPADPITPADTGTPAEPTPQPTPRPLHKGDELPAFHATPAPSMTTEATPRIPPIPPVQESVPQTPAASAPLTDTSNLNTPKSLGRARSVSALHRDDRLSGSGKRSTSAGPPPSQPVAPAQTRTPTPIDPPQPKAPPKDPKSSVSPPPIPPITTANGMVPAEWHYPLHVSLETLYSGAKLRYRVTRYLLSGQTQESYVDIEVKPGWRKGTKIRFAGLGNERQPPLPPQDVIFIVDELSHPKFRREGSNLFTTIDISLLEALSESSHVIPGLDGKDITVDIDFAGEIIRPGDVSRVIGKGMPIRRNSQVVGAGDLTIKWNVIFPDRLTSKQRNFIRLARDEDLDDRTS